MNEHQVECLLWTSVQVAESVLFRTHVYVSLIHVVICTTTSHNIRHFCFSHYGPMFTGPFFLVLVVTTTSQNIRHSFQHPVFAKGPQISLLNEISQLVQVICQAMRRSHKHTVKETLTQIFSLNHFLLSRGREGIIAIVKIFDLDFIMDSILYHSHILKSLSLSLSLSLSVSV